MMFERFALEGSHTLVIASADPENQCNGMQGGQYVVTYWVGISTPEAGSGGTLDCYNTDRLHNTLQQGHNGVINGSDPTGGIQGSFMVDFDGTDGETPNPDREIRLEFGISAPLGTLRYDYRVGLSSVVG